VKDKVEVDRKKTGNGFGSAEHADICLRSPLSRT
jgi:hypothetical protein